MSDTDEYKDTDSSSDNEEDDFYAYESESESSGDGFEFDDYGQSAYSHPVLKRMVSYDVLDDNKIQARQQKMMKKLATQLAM